MNRPFPALLLGGCALATAHVAQRLLAPFAGLGLTLEVATLVAALAGFALGAALGARALAPDRAGLLSARALLFSAALALAAALARRPLLEALSGAELRLVVTIGAILFAGLPLAGLGFAFAAGQGDAPAAEAVRGLGWWLAGAALAAPLVGYLVVPGLGLNVTLAVIAAVEAAVALAGGMRRAALPTAAGALAVLATAGAIAIRPAPVARLGPRLLEHRTGRQSEHRVFDRHGARYLLTDGSIQAVVDTLSGDCVQRGPAALELLKLFRPARDSMLVLGLRGGALPLAFARSGWRVRVVEPDEDAVAVSRRVSYRPGEMALAVEDPRRFVRRHAARYGVVVVDLGAGGELPYTLCTREFVESVSRCVTSDGVLVLAVESHGWGDPLVGSLAATLRTRFAHVLALPTGEPQTALGTVLLLASREPVPFADEQLPDLKTYFQNPDALWVAQQQAHAWLNRYQPEPAGAAVLSDDRSGMEVWADRVNHGSRAELHAFFGPHGGSW